MITKKEKYFDVNIKLEKSIKEVKKSAKIKEYIRKKLKFQVKVKMKKIKKTKKTKKVNVNVRKKQKFQVKVKMKKKKMKNVRKRV